MVHVAEGPSMNENIRLCFLIADGEHARLLRPDENNVLQVATYFDSATAHRLAHDLVSDRPGRTFESARPGSHGIEPRHEPHQLEKEKFAQLIARQLCHAAASDSFDRLVLVAPAHVLNDIEAALDEPTAAKVVGRLAKDLVKVPNHALARHLNHWVAVPHRVM
jgi:protein required for attachment to host cells